MTIAVTRGRRSTSRARAASFAAIALAAIAAADPDVDRAQVRRDLAPVVRRLEVRVADLHRADRPAVELGDEVLRELVLRRELLAPLDIVERDLRVRVVRRARDDVRVRVPEIEPGRVGVVARRNVTRAMKTFTCGAAEVSIKTCGLAAVAATDQKWNMAFAYTMRPRGS